ncbi:hypothetical protein [uncultured Prochlorococcus sp.]|uniref:hypothetical protein n=1 Tax=uncultured Prochlorococcus sp. TaxID=159733 RepID=UPI00258F59EC|nr:hypothetical protein [uncultured Prochlorococcus sp.]
MIISFDSRTFLNSRVRKIYKNKLSKSSLKNKFTLLSKSASGPKKFISDLILTLEEKNLCKTTFNFLKSDIHLLNAGFYSPIWEYFQPKKKNRVIIRLDGVGLDSENIDFNKIKNRFHDLLNKGSYVIFQSEFSKNCFSNIYHSIPKCKIIYNGAMNCELLSTNNKLIENIKKHFKDGFFTVSGRFCNRKRIYEITKEFDKYELGNLVVLSDVPDSMRFNNKRIIYLGMVNPEIARSIISVSKALIHFDRYDWCPNIVIGALFDKVPVICSNYGGTPEIVGKNGLIIDEFPKDLPHDLEGINFVKRSSFPCELFRESITNSNLYSKIDKDKSTYDIYNSALKYVKTAYDLFK